LQEDDTLRLAAVGRHVPAGDPPATAALRALIDGPTGDERAADFEYPLDRRTRVHSVAVEDRVAVVDFGEGIERVHGRPYSELVYWSIVYTLTEAPGVDAVALRHDGQPMAALGDPPFALPQLGTRDGAPDWALPR